MRKVIVSEMVSLDGFFAGPNGEIDWHVVDEEFNEFAVDQLNAMDTLLFGRVTYQGMVSYWPTPAAIQADPIVADKMNTLPKLVFSRTLDKVEWGTWDNASLVKGEIGGEITKRKQQPGKDMVIFGSGSVVSALTQLGLIDEYRILIVPVILGKGIPMFKGIAAPINLKLVRSRILKTGVALMYYEPAQKSADRSGQDPRSLTQEEHS